LKLYEKSDPDKITPEDLKLNALSGMPMVQFYC
jgi:hypothetical protein